MIKKPRRVTAERLHCLYCAAELDVGAVRDGKSSLAEKYDSDYSPNWEYLVALECRKCGAVYPLLRAKSLCDISATAVFVDVQNKQNNSV